MRRLAWLSVLAVLPAIGCASRAVPQPFPKAPTATSTTADGGGAAWSSGVVATALMLRGAPYKNGGTDPKGFDCSGFVQYVFARHGRALPREVRDQFKLGTEIKRADLRAGDLVFFQTVSPGASHVGISLGGDEFVHAPSSNGVVRVERTTTGYWATRWVGARRVG